VTSLIFMDSNESIFISAGDPSADFPGKILIDEIRHACPDIYVFGLGGPLMQEAGLKPMADHTWLAVMGFLEIIPRFFFFRDLLKRTAAEIEARRPRAIVLMDYPGFNLRLAKRVRSLGIPIIYFISPQVWAWGARRIKTIKRVVDLMLVVFPFEEPFYRRHEISVRFVGHPIVDRYRSFPDKMACREKLNITSEQRLIALLPGSRLQEIRRMLPEMVKASALIAENIPEAVFVVAGVNHIDQVVYRRIMGDASISVIVDRTPEIINGADLVIASSGTATVETAFFATPMFVIYKTGFMTYQIAKRLVKLDSIGMVNIVAGRKIVPELIQREANAKAIADQAMDILGDTLRYNRMISDLVTVREQLGSGNTGRRVLAAIQETVRLC
jgi:lipid-A-disaccharide synthase